MSSNNMTMTTTEIAPPAYQQVEQLESTASAHQDWLTAKVVFGYVRAFVDAIWTYSCVFVNYLGTVEAPAFTNGDEFVAWLVDRVRCKVLLFLITFLVKILALPFRMIPQAEPTHARENMVDPDERDPLLRAWRWFWRMHDQGAISTGNNVHPLQAYHVRSGPLPTGYVGSDAAKQLTEEELFERGLCRVGWRGDLVQLRPGAPSVASDVELETPTVVEPQVAVKPAKTGRMSVFKALGKKDNKDYKVVTAVKVSDLGCEMVMQDKADKEGKVDKVEQAKKGQWANIGAAVKFGGFKKRSAKA